MAFEAPLAYARDVEIDDEPLSVLQVLALHPKGLPKACELEDLSLGRGSIADLRLDLGTGKHRDSWRNFAERRNALRKAWKELTPELCGCIMLSCCFAVALNFLGTSASCLIRSRSFLNLRGLA